MRPARERTAVVESIIEAELAAAEAYRAAVAAGVPGASELRRIEDEHRQAAAALRRKRRVPSQPAGAGACWVEVSGDAQAVLRALLGCEEREARECEAALETGSLDAAARALVASQLLPQARAHMATLGRLGAAGEAP
jgi:hypothetical protein